MVSGTVLRAWIRRRKALAGFLVVALSATILAAVSPPTASAAPCTSDAMYIVAHPDDSLLFQSPDLVHDIRAGGCVTTVFTTAGDAGLDSSFYTMREQAAQKAYATMAGTGNAWSQSSTVVGGQSIRTMTLNPNPNVQLLFMRLPDGDMNGGGYSRYQNQSLLKLWRGTISTIKADDNSATYTKTSFVDTLVALMGIYRPNQIRTQDWIGVAAIDNDHSDHFVSAYASKEAHTRYATAHTISSYMGYDSEFSPQNVFNADLTDKVNAFNAYDSIHDVCNPSCSGTQYERWLRRQYVIASETGGPVVNQAPVANAGPAQTVVVSSQVTLDGTLSSDPNGDPLTYAWTQTAGPAVTLSSATAARPTFTAPASTTSLTFQLIVRDAALNSTPSTVVITVAANRPPVANAGPAQTVGASALVQLNGTASSDPDGSPLTYAWSQTAGPVVTLAGATSATPTFTAPASATSLSFGLVVSDGLASSAASSVTINVVTTVNAARTSTATASSQDLAAGQGANKAIDGVVDGYPGDATKEWSTIGGRAGSWIRLTFPSPTTINKVVLYDRPNDTDGILAGNLVFDNGTVLSVGALPDLGGPLAITVPNITTLTVTFNITQVAGGTVNVGLAEFEAWSSGSGGGPNQAPTANAGPAQTVKSGALVTLNGTGSFDPELQPITYAWSQTAGPAVTLTGATTSRPTFTAPASGTSLTFQLVVSDGSLQSTPSTVTITVAPNLAPVANAGAAQTVGVNANVALNGTASSDPDGDPLTYAWTQTAGPAVTLSSSTSASPTFLSPAASTSLTFQLVVNDGKVASAPSSVTITVLATFNAARSAVATASSQNVSTGQTADKAIDGVPAGWPGDYTKEWVTVGGRAGSWLRLTWTTAVTLNKVVLYDRPNGSEQVTAGNLVFENGTTITFGALTNNGAATPINVPNITTRTLLVNITAVSNATQNTGLTEVEAWTAG